MRAERRETLLALSLVLPAVGIVLLVALFPLAWNVWESLHLHDLRMPWRGRPFIGLQNYRELWGDPRFWGALAHTAFFSVATVVPELVLGTLSALIVHRAFSGRGIVRAVLLLPWVIPTVVAALLWRFMFDGQASLANALLQSLGLLDRPVAWLVSATAAWVPVILADVWKTTPFVMLLVLAALQQVDGELYEAARVDGAGAWSRFVHVTLPELRPAILVALIFRTLDALRVFDLVYVMTGGGPGTATEPVALYTFNALLQHLRFGYGAALSVVVFLVTCAIALLYVRALGGSLTRTAS